MAPTSLLLARVLPRPGKLIRLGFSVSGRLGNAVVRNRIRRRLQALARGNLQRLRGGVDVVIIARKGAGTASAAELTAAWCELMAKADLIRPPES